MKKKRRIPWLPALVILLVGATAALAIPGSPVYLPMFSRWFHNYRSTRHWAQELNNPDAEARLKAIKELGAIGSDARDAIPALSTIMLEDSDRFARIEASLAIKKMHPATRDALPALIRALEDEEPWVRMNVVLSLVQLHEEARPAVPALIKALKNENNQTNLGKFPLTIQEAAASALGWASAGSDEAVPALLEALETEDAKRGAIRRQIIARALGLIGPEARPAVPKLKAMLKDQSDDVRRAAEDALKRIEE
jgi:hypothetical protein